jgi:uncharacterized membrane protein
MDMYDMDDELIDEDNAHEVHGIYEKEEKQDAAKEEETIFSNIFSVLVGIALIAVTSFLWNRSNRRIRTSLVTSYEDSYYDPEEDAL